MNLLLQFVVVIMSTMMVALGPLVILDEDFHPMWRKVIGYLLVVFGLILYRHGLNYLAQLP